MTYTILLRGGAKVSNIPVDKTPLQLETYIRELQGTVHFVKFVNESDIITMMDPNEIVGFEYLASATATPTLGGKA
jgi:hypothetical protein